MWLKNSSTKMMARSFGIYWLLFVAACGERELTVNHVKPAQNGSYYNSPPAYRQQVSPQYYYQQPQQPYPYYGQAAPSSRFYSNPYAIPPSTQYQYYDADQYYVPPTYQNNIESQYNGSGPF